MIYLQVETQTLQIAPSL